jgi:carboxymethylenebutenolidase
MCFDADAAPPALTSQLGPIASRTLMIKSADGIRFAAYLATPSQTHAVSSTNVLVLPDQRGLADFYRQLADQLAGHGYPALTIDYYGRIPGMGSVDRVKDFPSMQHLQGLSRSGLQADIMAAGAYLRQEQPGAGGTSVVALGFCLGGRLAILGSAPRFGFAGVIGFYGVPGVAGPYGPGPTQHAHELKAPILAVFGGADEGIPPVEVAAFTEALVAADVPHQIVVYPEAPHGFFDTRRDEFAEASADAWQRVLIFLQRCRDI